MNVGFIQRALLFYQTILPTKVKLYVGKSVLLQMPTKHFTEQRTTSKRTKYKVRKPIMLPFHVIRKCYLVQTNFVSY